MPSKKTNQDSPNRDPKLKISQNQLTPKKITQKNQPRLTKQGPKKNLPRKKTLKQHDTKQTNIDSQTRDRKNNMTKKQDPKKTKSKYSIQFDANEYLKNTPLKTQKGPKIISQLRYLVQFRHPSTYRETKIDRKKTPRRC